MQPLQQPFRILLFAILLCFSHSAQADIRWGKDPDPSYISVHEFTNFIFPMIYEGDTVKLSAVVITTNRVTYQWMYLGYPLGGDWNDPWATNSTVIFTNIQPGLFSAECWVTVHDRPDAYHEVSSPVICEVEHDTNPPVVAVTFPLPEQRITNSTPQASAQGISTIRTASNLVPLKGTSRDKQHIRKVEYTLNGGDWQTAVGTTNWYDSLKLAAGTNFILVKCYDMAGNPSAPLLRKVFYVVTNQLDFSIEGAGTVLTVTNSAVTNGQWLEVGRGYTFKAVPAPGYVFKNWSGDVSGTTPIFNFVMRSNMVLQANFITNQCIPAAGVYNGLFYETNGVAPDRAGFANLTLKTNGIYSGRITIDGDTFGLAGAFNPVGASRVTILRSRQGKASLTVNLNLNYEGNPDQISGTVSDGLWTADLLMDRNVYSTNRLATNYAGSYTMLIPNNDNADAPPGYGYGIIKVATNGLVTYSGSMADNIRPTQGVPLSKTGQWPLFATLYPYRYAATNATNSSILYTNAGFKGLVLGWMNITNEGIAGDLNWIKASWTNIYPNGFTNDTAVLGSRYVAPALRAAVLSITNGTITASGGDLTADLVKTAVLLTNNNFSISLPNTNKLRALVTASSGLWQGSFLTATNKTATFTGVVLQQQGFAGGFFMGTNLAGKVEFKGN